MNYNERMLNALKEIKTCCDEQDECEDCVLYGETVCDEYMPSEWDLDELAKRKHMLISSEEDQPKIKYLEEGEH